MAEFNSLVGQFLVAVPGIDDIRFDRTVIYVYNHSERDGARGIVINKPAEKVLFRDILTQLNFPNLSGANPPILLGGPDKITSGFILHSTDYKTLATQEITPDLSLTATQDILRDIAIGKGPQEYLMAIGCASWHSGQLEDELMGNVWLTAPATNQILFHTPYDERWSLAMKSMGINPVHLSTISGKA